MNETVKKVGRWLTAAAMSAVLWAVAAWLGINAWESSRETASTPLGQLTLGQLGATLFWGIGALVVAVFAWAMWEDRDERNKNW